MDDETVMSGPKPWATPTLVAQPIEAVTIATFEGAVFDGSFTS